MHLLLTTAIDHVTVQSDLPARQRWEVEIAFAHEGESEEGEGAALWVFRYAGGRVTRLARVANAQYLSDVDGDERPDAVAIHRRLWETPAEFHQDPHDVCVDEVRAPMTAARSLPGGAFSITDPAVRAYNRRECPARPSTIVARDANGAVDEATTARTVVCAGAWGVRRATISAATSTATSPRPGTRRTEDPLLVTSTVVLGAERGGAAPRFARVVGAVQSSAAPHAAPLQGVSGEVVVEAKLRVVEPEVSQQSVGRWCPPFAWQG